MVPLVKQIVCTSMGEGRETLLKLWGSTNEMEEFCDRAARKYMAKRMGIGGDGGGVAARPPPSARVDFMNACAEHLRNIIKERVSHPDHYETPPIGFKGSCVALTYEFQHPHMSCI